MDNIKKKIIHAFVVIFITVLISTIVVLVILKYNIEGENNMPFELSKIMLVSSAEGVEDKEEDSEDKWNLNIHQNNDIYLEIFKNKNYEDVEIIDEIKLDNFEIIEKPQKGKIVIYRPDSNEGRIYVNDEKNIVNNEIIYMGAEETSIKDLKIANQGGMIFLRYSLEELGKYISNDDEIRHDGTMLSKIGIKYDEIKCKIKFDISIKLKSDITYTGTVELNLPAGDILEEGTSTYQIIDLKDVIFKRNLK